MLCALCPSQARRPVGGCSVIGVRGTGRLDPTVLAQRGIALEMDRRHASSRQYPWKQPTYLGNARAKYSGCIAVSLYRACIESCPEGERAWTRLPTTEAAPFQRESGDGSVRAASEPSAAIS